MARSKWLERTLTPYAIMLQVTPIVAIAPLLLIYLSPQERRARLRLSRRLLSDPLQHGARDSPRSTMACSISSIYIGPPPGTRLIHLRAPAALPQFLTGLRIAGGLALIGAVVAELAAGAAGQGTGLAFRIVEAGFRLDIPRMFGALALLSRSLAWRSMARCPCSAITR